MKKTYIITYDMSGEGDYEELYEAIKEYGTWAHINDSTWAIVTEDKAKEIRDYLIDYLTDGSSLFVIKSGTEAAWRNITCSNKWLKKNL